MQYLKDEMRNNILMEALKEFSKNGYKGASIRVIVKSSNTSVGNFYKYFESKEDLYEKLIGAVYDRLMSYINEFYKVEINEQAVSIFYMLMEKIVEIFEENRTELSILLNKSEGSKYENCKKVFVDFITKFVTEYVNYQLSLRGEILKDNFIIYLLSCSLVESIAIMLRDKEDGAGIRRLILNMIHIFYDDIWNKIDN